MQRDTITVLWIEDNPGLSDKEAVKIVNEIFEIPSFKSLGNNQYDFTLKILQHPEEIREYLYMCYRVAEKEGYHKLAEINGVVPDIVVFDYMLSENFNTSGRHCISYAKGFKPVRALFNPVYSLKEKFNETLFKDYEIFPERSRNYKVEAFFRSINGQTSDEDYSVVEQDIQSSLNDEFGLFAGIAVVRFFKDNITCGLPATFNKMEKAKLQTTAKFYEWLNGYDLEIALQRENKGKKDWKSILDDAVKLLQNRIATQVQLGRVLPDYCQLNDLSEGNISKEPIFSFETIYGKRNLPLAALFIDSTDKKDREIKITEWAKQILKNLPIENTIIKKAAEISKTLWNTYIDFFEDRIILSDYTNREGQLNEAEQSLLEKVKKRLDVNSKNEIEQECSIQTLFDGINENENKNVIARLAVLMTIAKANIELNKQRYESRFDAKYYELTKEEYVNLLFPKVNFGNSLLLSFNLEKDRSGHIETETKWLIRNLTLKESNVTLKNLFVMSEWVLKGEKEILRSFFYHESKYFPQWLKS